MFEVGDTTTILGVWSHDVGICGAQLSKYSSGLDRRSGLWCSISKQPNHTDLGATID